jgi:putative membrane protein
MIDYDPHDWRSHLCDIRGSMLREITSRILACVLWATGITWFHFAVHECAIPGTAHMLVGPALALLLVFRTNASYDRFWEGRRMWGNIINESRNLARLASAVFAEDTAFRRRLMGWILCFPDAMRYHLRGQKNLGKFAASLPPQSADRAQASDHPPLAVALEISRHWIEARNSGLISDYLLVALDQNVQLLIDYMGSCERIHKTPLPFAYVVHLRRAILIYCFTVPFGLLKDFAWWTPVCTLLIAYLLVGIEEIGVEIEDPFGEDDNDLPLEVFCETIQRNIGSLAAGGDRSPAA